VFHTAPQDIPLSKLRGLGGKLGAALQEQFGAATAGEVQAVPLEALQRGLGERGCGPARP
jgi:DNA polymerase eta